MAPLLLLLGFFCIAVAALESFETVVLPRTVKRGARLTGLYFDLSSKFYRTVGRMRPGSLRQSLLNGFAPVLLLLLIGMWATLFVVGFGLVHFGLGTHFSNSDMTQSLFRLIYFSGVTFFTLGYGDAVPTDDRGRFLGMLEGGLGFAFLGLIIAYVPVIYGSFSRREVNILLLDTRAGSDPTGFELLRRHADGGVLHLLPEYLREWERVSAELLESYLSYPILAYYRSQHDDQSWLRSLVAVLDACALLESGAEGDESLKALHFQARATFAMGRHLLVDLAYILDIPPDMKGMERLNYHRLDSMRDRLADAGLPLGRTGTVDARLCEIREMYEPYAASLAAELVLELPAWIHDDQIADHWQTSAWEGVKHF